MSEPEVQIISFYEFRDMSTVAGLADLRELLCEMFRVTGVRGTLILADEGYNGMICGSREQVNGFITSFEGTLISTLRFKSSFSESAPFRKIDVKVKPEIVTLKRPVNITLGHGTHVAADRWNKIISDPETLVLDARNDYEFKTGTFRGAVNPGTAKFSELPDFVEQNLHPGRHKRVAIFCTGGIRCEKFAPYLRERGFEEVYQLDGGILKYLETVPPAETLWQGECFVFDERITVDASLNKGRQQDLSQRHKSTE